MNRSKIAVNTIYTVAGALVLNGVLQLLVYPSLARRLGAAANGTVLYLMGFVNILGPTVGQALNNSRLVVRREAEVKNGDYNLAVLILSAIGCAAVLPAAWHSLQGPAVLLFPLLIFLTNFRYYGDVEYRLSLNYRAYLIYYVLCGAGYGAGYLLWRAGAPYFVIFLAGEAAALAYVAAKGSIFRQFFVRSPHFGLVMSKGTVLVLSYFVTNLTLNIDRLYLKGALGGEAVSHYYAVSLIGKTLVLFVAPINTVLISYLTRGESRLGRRQFAKLAAAGGAVSAVFFALCAVGTPIFIRLFYPDYAAATAALTAIVSLSQILAMYSAYLFIIVLSFTSASWQLGLQCAHLGLLLVLIACMTPGGGLAGFSAAVLLANGLRVAAVIVLGLVKAPGRESKKGA